MKAVPSSPALGHVGGGTSCFRDSQPQYLLLPPQTKAHLLAWGRAVLGLNLLGPPVLCVLPLPWTRLPPVPETGTSAGVTFYPLCLSSLQPTCFSRSEQACCLWCPSTNLSCTSLGCGPLLLLCKGSFFSRAAPDALQPDTASTCSGSGLGHSCQGCLPASALPLPVFFFLHAKVFS